MEIMKIHPDATIPGRAHPDDAGLDLVSVDELDLPPQSGRLVRTGIAVAIPQQHVGMIADRSSMAKKGLKTAGGIIDAGYRGEVMVVLWNLGRETAHISRGDRIAQLLVIPIATPAVNQVETLDSTGRGAGGFGSTGK